MRFLTILSAENRLRRAATERNVMSACDLMAVSPPPLPPPADVYSNMLRFVKNLKGTIHKRQGQWIGYWTCSHTEETICPATGSKSLTVVESFFDQHGNLRARTTTRTAGDMSIDSTRETRNITCHVTIDSDGTKTIHPRVRCTNWTTASKIVVLSQRQTDHCQSRAAQAFASARRWLPHKVPLRPSLTDGYFADFVSGASTMRMEFDVVGELTSMWRVQKCEKEHCPKRTTWTATGETEEHFKPSHHGHKNEPSRITPLSDWINWLDQGSDCKSNPQVPSEDAHAVGLWPVWLRHGFKKTVPLWYNSAGKWLMTWADVDRADLPVSVPSPSSFSSVLAKMQEQAMLPHIPCLYSDRSAWFTEDSHGGVQVFDHTGTLKQTFNVPTQTVPVTGKV